MESRRRKSRTISRIHREWTDWGASTLAFNVYLTGYDVQSLNLRDVLNGRLPGTGPIVSPQGSLSDAKSGRDQPIEVVAQAAVVEGISPGVLEGQLATQCGRDLLEPDRKCVVAADRRLAFRNMVRGDADSLLRGRGRWLVVHRSLPAEEERVGPLLVDGRVRYQLRIAGPDAARRLRTAWGPARLP